MIGRNNREVKYSASFNRQFKSLPFKIKTAFREARQLFSDNQKHSSLRNHGLKKNYQGYRSIDVTDDYRAIYKTKLEGKKEVITFYLIGTHKELYGK